MKQRFKIIKAEHSGFDTEFSIKDLDHKNVDDMDASGFFYYLGHLSGRDLEMIEDLEFIVEFKT